MIPDFPPVDLSNFSMAKCLAKARAEEAAALEAAGKQPPQVPPLEASRPVAGPVDWCEEKRQEKREENSQPKMIDFTKFGRQPAELRAMLAARAAANAAAEAAAEAEADALADAQEKIDAQAPIRFADHPTLTLPLPADARGETHPAGAAAGEATGPAGEKDKTAGGRPRALGTDAKRTIVKLVARGFTFTEAAGLLQCDRKTILRERQHDGAFDAELLAAKAKSSTEPKEVVAEAAKTNWRAAAFLIRHQLALVDRQVKARQERLKREIAAQRTAQRAASKDDQDGPPELVYDPYWFPPLPNEIRDQDPESVLRPGVWYDELYEGCDENGFRKEPSE